MIELLLEYSIGSNDRFRCSFSASSKFVVFDRPFPLSRNFRLGHENTLPSYRQGSPELTSQRVLILRTQSVDFASALDGSFHMFCDGVFDFGGDVKGSSHFVNLIRIMHSKTRICALRRSF